MECTHTLLQTMILDSVVNLAFVLFDLATDRLYSTNSLNIYQF